ncbi:DUF3857 domain-containing protein [Mucilaginibacter galii]|uniref:DUF3857 domain-containing protein n=1 Tax=Mucilaginibacter galii TaxID=2005073 RepID=A0A917J992_9SPHI|nr:DUF3857 domain-containing protein [Mucilaginibacter galii]GGI49634.1 hypothetical protein GCM10011425_08460 [Mucilaginibacter galii]
MKKIFTSLAVSLLAVTFAAAQEKVVTTTQAYGKIDKADLSMKVCDFEKDANAMVLFDKGDVYYDNDFNIILERHKRVKILTESGKKEADVRIEYYGGNKFEYLTGLQGEIFNLNNDNVEITKLDKKQIFTEVVDKSRLALVFTFPNVKAGSVIEYKYKQTINSLSAIPDWFFQEDIPVRHSELVTTIPDYFYFRTQQRNSRPFTKYATSVDSRSITGGSGNTPLLLNENKTRYVMSNVASMVKEPYMTSEVDNLQCIYFQLSNFNPPAGFSQSYSNSWAKVGGILADDEDFGLQLRKKLTGEETIIAKAKSFKTDEQKIAYVFNEVKNNMKWNSVDRWYTNDGTPKAWEKKTGNSAEVNLILYRLLKQSGVKAYPMVVSTREHGKVNPAYSFLYQFNRAVVYIPIDSTRRYILDATSKYNSYLETPANLLNSYGLFIDKENKRYDIVFLQREAPVRHVVMINADILPDGKMSGLAQISNFCYDRYASIENYKTNGEKKYIDYLRDNDNNLSITALKMDNIEADSLPLTQQIKFNLNLTSSDKDYIIFNPNLFTSMKTNPFLSENRFSDIDFGHTNNYNLTGIYKIPAGYKSDALPKSISIVMPDQSIICRRMVIEQDGSIMVRYTINYNKVIYGKENYPDLQVFYKKMHELLNEQVVLKKS